MDENSAKAKGADVVHRFQSRFAEAMEICEVGIDDVLSYLHYSPPNRTRLSFNNLIERVNQEIRRRTRVVDIFQHRVGVPQPSRHVAR